MNERIKELTEQAGAIPIHGEPKNRALVGYDNIEKFAELLLMECITICEELGDKGMDGHYCADKINKTFRS